MFSDTESSNSSSRDSSREHKRHKLDKKHKKKAVKKEKKRKKSKKEKKEKRSKHEKALKVKATDKSTEPLNTKSLETAKDDTAFGPALPPHLLQNQITPENPNKAEMERIIGPVMPSDVPLQTAESTTFEDHNETHNDEDMNDDDDIDMFGPMPVGAGGTQMSATQLELEQRALELKLANITGNSTTNVDQTVREEWMLELPAVGLKTGLAALANMKRTFHQGKERPDFSDRSSWTKTPQSDVNPTEPSTSKSTMASLQDNAQALYERQRDEEQERIAKKHKKKHKRNESLVELHQKKLRKEQRRKEKELAAIGAKPERRPFSRDVDLKLNKIDSNQTKQIVDKAKILDSKFSTGHTKYL